MHLPDRPYHLYGYREMREQAGTKDNAIYLYAVQWSRSATEASSMQEEPAVVVKMPPPENRKVAE